LNRILVIRGGAIGDFVLTLPAIKALRDAYPAAHLEILGYKHIAAIAENRFYVQAVRSIEQAPLAGFFAKDASLASELTNYFASFDLIVSYLFDPEAIFESNLRRCGVQKLVRGPAKIIHPSHAARQLAQPIEQLGIRVRDLASKLYPSSEDRHRANEFRANLSPPITALHPGSGSEGKNWPLENWIRLGDELLNSTDFTGSLLIVLGEADQHRTQQLESIWKTPRVRFAINRPLPDLAAVLENTMFLGHDSGISHLAAAADATCILLFGPTDPAIWAPLNENVRTIRGSYGRIDNISVRDVQDEVAKSLAGEDKTTARQPGQNASVART
jgi:heptosyltransferase III